MLKAILLALLGLSYTIFSIVSMLDGRALDARGRTAQIEPLETVTEITRKRNNQPYRISYEGQVRFVTAGGQAVSVKKTLEGPQIEDMMQGKPVLIRYLPDKPTTARFESEKGSGGLDVAIGAIVLLAGGMWFRKKLFEKPDFRE